MRSAAEKKYESDDSGQPLGDQGAAGLKFLCISLRQRGCALAFACVCTAAVGGIGGWLSNGDAFFHLGSGEYELDSMFHIRPYNATPAGFLVRDVKHDGETLLPAKDEQHSRAPSSPSGGPVPPRPASLPAGGPVPPRPASLPAGGPVPPRPASLPAGGPVPPRPASLPAGGPVPPRPASLPAGGPVPPFSQPDSATPVHLVISAFGDGARCARTMSFALEKAEYPDRLHFRVMQAYEDRDVACGPTFAKTHLKSFCREPKSHWTTAAACEAAILSRVRVWKIHLSEGMGPAHQRGLLNERLDFDDPSAFCMTTDSHMDFRHHWDTETIEDWLRTGNEFAVLSAYPMRMMPNQDRIFAKSHVDLCGYWLENGIPRGKTGGNLPTTKWTKPYFTMNWAAGFSFHRCHADRNVPVDKHLKWIFTGEEINRAVRLWTSGYDLYLPSGSTVYHDYGAAKQEFWNHAPASMHQDSAVSRIRLQSLLKLRESGVPPPEELAPYGPGHQRTVEQYVEWSRIDLGTPRWDSFLKEKGLTPSMDKFTAEGSHTFCQTLQRVPVTNVQELYDSIFKGGPPRTKDVPPPITLPGQQKTTSAPSSPESGTLGAAADVLP